MNVGAVRMPLLGCLALAGVFFLCLLGAIFSGWSGLRYRNSAPAVSSSAPASSPASQPSISPSPNSEIPFSVPDGYYARRVSRQLPCGRVVDMYIVVPAFEPPCE